MGFERAWGCSGDPRGDSGEILGFLGVPEQILGFCGGFGGILGGSHVVLASLQLLQQGQGLLVCQITGTLPLGGTRDPKIHPEIPKSALRSPKSAPKFTLKPSKSTLTPQNPPLDPKIHPEIPKFHPKICPEIPKIHPDPRHSINPLTLKTEKIPKKTPQKNPK